MTPTARPALLLIHGFTGTGAAWADHLPELSRRFDLIAPDLPGHGANPVGASVEAAADDLAPLAGDGRIDVLGYSLGARVALALAVAHPGTVDRLVLESPSAGLSDPAERAARRAADERLAHEIERDGIEAFVDRWERNPVFASHAALNPEVAARQRAVRLAQDPHGLAQSLRLAGQGAMTPLRDRLGEIARPTLVIVGALDPTRPRGELVASGIPGARLVVIDGAGHTPHLERPDAFRRLVIDFLLEDAAA
jgi:2-succinyl-6-hydroxy-2,4-cyclohexadiene-1-carboxylate synthase